MTWIVDISVPFDGMDQWRHITDTLEALSGNGCESAGTGFGQRDMQFAFENVKEATIFFANATEKFPDSEATLRTRCE